MSRRKNKNKSRRREKRRKIDDYAEKCRWKIKGEDGKREGENVNETYRRKNGNE